MLRTDSKKKEPPQEGWTSPAEWKVDFPFPRAYVMSDSLGGGGILAKTTKGLRSMFANDPEKQDFSITYSFLPTQPA